MTKAPDFCLRVRQTGAVCGEDKLSKVHCAVFVVVKHAAQDDYHLYQHGDDECDIQ